MYGNYPASPVYSKPEYEMQHASIVRTVRRPAKLVGELAVPGDKSISHRSLILNAMANGTARVSGLSNGEDVMSTMTCLQAMGVEIKEGDSAGEYTVQGRGPVLEEPSDILDAGNSGTSMRLLSGLLAAQPFLTVITGDGSLRSRPMRRIVEPLQSMGAQVMGRRNGSLAPLAIQGGSLRGIEYDLPVASAQVKSCIMLGALSAGGETVIHQPALSRDHTERMVTAMGASIEENGLTLHEQGEQRTAPVMPWRSLSLATSVPPHSGSWPGCVIPIPEFW